MPSEVVNTSASARRARCSLRIFSTTAALSMRRYCDLDAVFGAERGRERAHDLIDDHGRVEDDTAFLLRRGDQRGIDLGRARGFAERQRDDQEGKQEQRRRKNERPACAATALYLGRGSYAARMVSRNEEVTRDGVNGYTAPWTKRLSRFSG